MDKQKTILITGAQGQIGTELAEKLSLNHRVICSDISENNTSAGEFVHLDVTNKNDYKKVLQEFKVDEIFHLAAILSAKGEKDPKLAWSVNLTGGLNAIELTEELNISKIFWPSSIAVFGKQTQKENTPQHSITDPSTIYGITKLAGERWSEYFFEKKQVDIRSIRYPGLISYKTKPGGGTTDYAVEIFHQAKKAGTYQCFLNEDLRLPMMFMDDAILATLQLMSATASDISIRSAYNVCGFNFTPKELAAEIKKHLPNFTMTYRPDYRNEIAKSWPSSMDDAYAKQDWNWKPRVNFSQMVELMLKHI